MSSLVSIPDALAAPSRRTERLSPILMRRIALVLLTVGAFGVALAWRPAAPAAIDPDLARLLRYMALLKGAFAAIALGLAWWRFARPAARWREAVYVAGPGLMASGALALGQLHAVGFATVWLHAGLLGFVAAALTDEGFIPAGLLRRKAKALTPRG